MTKVEDIKLNHEAISSDSWKSPEMPVISSYSLTAICSPPSVLQATLDGKEEFH